MYITTVSKNEAVHLKKSMERYEAGFGGRKEKGK